MTSPLGLWLLSFSGKLARVKLVEGAIVPATEAGLEAEIDV